MRRVCQWLEARPRRLWVAAGILLAALWISLWRQLSLDWSTNPQYSYGWGVPFLAIYLVWQRLQDRPEPEPDTRCFKHGLWALLLVAGLLPLHLVQEANPDWRAVSWMSALEAVGLTVIALDRIGGKRWVRHFGVAVAFPLLAVPWPTPMEDIVIQSLMRGVARVSAEVVHWFGVPAVQRGNLIFLTNGVVGIDEACSGVRSVQSTLMMSVFLGELFCFSAGRRTLLVVLGLGAALVLNLGRALLLTGVAAKSGIGRIQAWHDPAGYTVLVVAFVLVWWIAVRLRRSTPSPAPMQEPRAWPNPLPAALVLGFGTWLLLVGVGTEAWYRAHELKLTAPVTWALDWPTQEQGFSFDPVDESARRILRYSDGESARWHQPDGSEWFIFWFRWKAGRTSPGLAHAHPPELCLQAGGFRLVNDLGVQEIRTAGLSLPFRVYDFEAQGRPFHVFYCLWEERAEREAGGVDNQLSRWSRLQAVRLGQRNLGQSVLEIAVGGRKDKSEAENEVKTFLQKAIHRAPGA